MSLPLDMLNNGICQCVDCSDEMEVNLESNDFFFDQSTYMELTYQDKFTIDSGHSTITYSNMKLFSVGYNKVILYDLESRVDIRTIEELVIPDFII